VGPVSLSSPEAGRRTHRAFDRAFIGLLHKDERLSHTGQSLPTTGSAVIERHGLCRETAAPPRSSHIWCGAEKRSREPSADGSADSANRQTALRSATCQVRRHAATKDYNKSLPIGYFLWTMVGVAKNEESANSASAENPLPDAVRKRVASIAIAGTLLTFGMSAGAKIGHRAPLERCFAAE
jgi:hypothetical protein